ncbi:hypothetical protein WL61_11115 [Burkholderia ubonensis]|nr:hypothetical protein WK14_26385 [Burkholderia ubonensis]KWD23045.1 hypothetical protein WL61_11115 [Burkholderia ubonensis]
MQWLGILFLPVFGWSFALFLELGELLGLPACAALGEDTLQKLGTGFGESAEIALRFAPGGGKRAFDGGLEQGLAVLLQLLLSSLQLCYSGIEVRQQFFELGDDASLLCWCFEGERVSSNVFRPYSGIQRALHEGRHRVDKASRLD